jgi:hypothetical protein
MSNANGRELSTTIECPLTSSFEEALCLRIETGPILGNDIVRIYGEVV